MEKKIEKKVERLEDRLDYKKFSELGIKYTVDSIVFLADHNKTMNDAIDFYGKADNIIYLVGAGLKDKSIDNAKNVIMNLLNNGVCLEVMYCLCVIKAREDGFFMNERGLETLESVSQSKSLLENKAVMDIMLRVMAQYQKGIEVQEKMI